MTAVRETPGEVDGDGTILDRGRAAMRVPVALLRELVDFLAIQGPGQSPQPPASFPPNLLSADVLDPVVIDLIKPITNASLKIEIAIRMGDDSSAIAIWATPTNAVLCTRLDSRFFDISGVTVSRLPDVLAETVVLRRPRFTAPTAIAVPSELMTEADRQREDPAKAREVLESGRDAFMNDLTSESIDYLVAFQAATTRRWRISTAWSTDRGYSTAELRGLDAGPYGQWTVQMAEVNETASMLFTPKGDGEMLAEFREVLPRYWINTALRSQGVEVLPTIPTNTDPPLASDPAA